MTLIEARIDLSQKIADAINESKMPPTMARLVLADIDRALAQEEERLYQLAVAEKGEQNGTDKQLSD